MPAEIMITECQEHDFGIVVAFQVFDPQGNLISESSLSYSKLMSKRGLQASIRAEAEQLITEKSLPAPDIASMIGQRIPIASLPTIKQVASEETP